MAELTWRKEPPDKPGWWWFRVANSSRQHDVDMAMISERNGELVIGTVGNPVFTVEKFAPGFDWAGPIEPPRSEP